MQIWLKYSEYYCCCDHALRVEEKTTEPTGLTSVGLCSPWLSVVSFLENL